MKTEHQLAAPALLFQRDKGETRRKLAKGGHTMAMPLKPERAISRGMREVYREAGKQKPHAAFLFPDFPSEVRRKPKASSEAPRPEGRGASRRFITPRPATIY